MWYAKQQQTKLYAAIFWALVILFKEMRVSEQQPTKNQMKNGQTEQINCLKCRWNTFI